MTASPSVPFTLETDEQLGEPRKVEFDPTGFYLSDLIGLVAGLRFSSRWFDRFCRTRRGSFNSSWPWESRFRSLIIVIQSFAALMVISCAPFGLLFYLLTMWMPWNSGKKFARVRFGHIAKAIERITENDLCKR